MSNSVKHSPVGEGRSESPQQLKIVNDHLRFPKVRLEEPPNSGFYLLALEVDSKGPFFLRESHRKKDLLNQIQELLHTIKKIEYVIDASVFKARIIPPGKGAFLRKRKGKVHLAKFDVVVLIETTNYACAKTLRQNPILFNLEVLARENSRFQHAATAKNIRRMGGVDHNRQGVFLFNFFYSDDVDINLKVWEYTAGWFEQETKLDNSTLLRTQEDDSRLYNVINHCRWDKLSQVIPSLLFKRSFRSYVLANFEANNTAPIPILYKLV